MDSDVDTKQAIVRIVAHQSNSVTFLIIYFAFSIQQSPSREANRFSASQEIPRILWNPQGSLPHSQVPATCPYPEPARSNPYPNIPLPKIHLNIILPSTSGFPQWSFSLRFRHQNPVYASPLSHTCYMPRPSHSSRFYHPNNIW